MLALLLLACSANGDLQCTEDPGYAASATALAALDHANCYRDAMGLAPGLLDPVVDDATQAHADYMEANRRLDHQELDGEAGFTGEWVWDRLESAGYPLENGSGWSEVLAEGDGATGSVDRWINSVYHRIPFTMPDWRDVGFGQADVYTGMTFVTEYPARGRSAVLYPADGQARVPTTFDSDSEWPDPAPDQRLVGPPITLTVGDDQAGANGENPYGLELVSASLIGPDGAVEFLTLTPSDDDFLQSTVALVPTAPLTPDTDYDVELTVSWGGSEETVSGRFSTAQE